MRSFSQGRQRWEDEPARKRKLRAWEEIEKILKDGLEEVNWGSETIRADYFEVKNELGEATALMTKFHLFLPFLPLDKRVCLVRPRVSINGMILTDKPKEVRMTDRQVGEAHREYYLWYEERQWHSDSDVDSIATASSGFS